MIGHRWFVYDVRWKWRQHFGCGLIPAEMWLAAAVQTEVGCRLAGIVFDRLVLRQHLGGLRGPAGKRADGPRLRGAVARCPVAVRLSVLRVLGSRLWERNVAMVVGRSVVGSPEVLRFVKDFARHRRAWPLEYRVAVRSVIPAGREVPVHRTRAARVGNVHGRPDRYRGSLGDLPRAVLVRALGPAFGGGNHRGVGHSLVRLRRHRGCWRSDVAGHFGLWSLVRLANEEV